MLGMRIMTAVIGIPFAIYVIHFGKWLFAGVIAILAVLAWHEYCVMLYNKKIRVGFGYGAVATILLLFCSWLGNTQEILGVLVVFTLVMLSRLVLFNRQFGINDATFAIMGFSYISLSFTHFILLRFLDSAQMMTVIGLIPKGAAYLWVAFIGTWASDTFAYFIGKGCGKHKLCPAISPGKTVEGAIGGLFGSIVVTILVGLIIKLALHHSLILGILIGITAPLGDLVESVLKRFSGVKDSGKILPGHGGVLDRFDSIMFVVPVVYYYFYAFL